MTSLLLLLVSLLPAAQNAAAQAPVSDRLCPAPWRGAVNAGEDCRLEPMDVRMWAPSRGTSYIMQVPIRSGYIPENPEVPFRGNVIYYQGLGDSMLNHLPLFTKLTEAGYRVISFDYMGQGGSGGSMDNSRIYQINELGDNVWRLHARDTSHFPKMFVIGWSTGGLAAYARASQKQPVAMVLLAPGLVPNWFVGEQHPAELKFNMITMATLNSQLYGGGIFNPHVDPIKPTSALDAFSFAQDLLMTAKQEQSQNVPSFVKGLVFLSGPNDSYVNAAETREVLKRNAPHFKVIEFPTALHEIDNEAPAIAYKVQEEVLTFFESLPQF